MIDTTKMPGWNFDAEKCPCDQHFVEWLRGGTKSQRVLHMGTGLHHRVGMAGVGEVIGITISPEEHAGYVELVQNHPEVTEDYCVLFGDIYTLPLNLLGTFDVVSLFHLGEYHPTGYENRQVEYALLVGLAGHLSENGKVAFYTGSLAFNWDWLQYQIEMWAKDAGFKVVEEFETLRFYGRE